MELQSAVPTVKTSIINGSTISINIQSLKQQPKVNRTRTILLILISTLLVLCFTNFVFVAHLYTTNDSYEDQFSNISSQLVAVLISFVYYGFGILVTYRYYQTGLFVFAWLGFICLLLMLVIILFIIIALIAIILYLGFIKKIIIAIIFIIICLIVSLLQILTVRYTFVLSKLLENTRSLTIEQI